MALHGWYYLHENGSLIYKRELGGTAADIRESPFALDMWPCDPEDRASAWRIVIEALAAGADKERILQLAAKWGCDDKDAAIYADQIGCVLARDGNAWQATRTDFEDLIQSPAGFGPTCLEAMAELCKALGYKRGKMWKAEFADLLKGKESAASGVAP